jgi:hypothetical protein
MSEQTKDTIETAANAALAVAGVAGVKAATIPGMLGLAYAKFQQGRHEKWWTLVIEGREDPSDLVARINAGLAEEDDKVITGVVGGARAAAAAIELAAVPVIAALSRRYLNEQDLPRWFYRGALEVLERVDALELGALKTLLLEIKDIRSDSITIVGDAGGQLDWRAFQTPEQWQKLTTFKSPSRLFGYLKRAGLGYESDHYGTVASPSVLVIERDTSDWLRDALVFGLS